MDPWTRMQTSLCQLRGWSELDGELRDMLVRQDLTDPAQFRNLSDGSEESLVDLTVQLGGVPASVGTVRALWLQCERPHEDLVSSLSRFTSVQAAVRVRLAAVKPHRPLLL